MTRLRSALFTFDRVYFDVWPVVGGALLFRRRRELIVLGDEECMPLETELACVVDMLDDLALSLDTHCIVVAEA